MADDLAALAIKVTYSDALGASNALDSLSVAGARADGAVGGLARTSQSSIASMNLLRASAIGLFGAFSVKTLFDITDAWSDMTSRVILTAGSIEKGGAVMSRLQEIARGTYSSLNQTAEGYLANASSMRELGYSTQQVLDYTSAFNNAMVVSGAKAERATIVQTALGKAMALGKLSGENLNTVIQQGGEVATLLAERFGTTTGGLLKLGQQGKITGDILVETLIKAMADLEQKAGEMPATISDGFGQIANSLLSLIGKFDSATGASETFAEALLFVADNLEQIVIVGGSAAVIYGGGYVAAMVASKIATIGLTGALTLLRTALIKTGVGALLVGLGQLVYMLIEARRASDDWGGAFQKLVGRLSLLSEGFKWTFYAMVDGMKAAWARGMVAILQYSEKTFGVLARVIGVAFGGFADTIKELKLDVSDLGKNAGGQLRLAGDKFSEAFAKFGDGSGDIVSLEDKIARLTVAANDNDKSARRLAKAWDDLLRGAKDRVAQMELEAQLVGKNAIEAEVLRIKLEALQEAEKKGLKLKPEQIAMLNELADKYGALAAKVAEYQLMADAAFEREQMFRSPIDQRIMQDLKMAGIEIDSIAGQTYASFVKTTDQIGLAKDATRDFAGSLVSDLIQGKSALDSLISALGKLGDKLIQLALDEAINGLFGNLFGAVGGGGFNLLGGKSDPWSGMRVPGFASGTANTGGMPGQPIGIVHGQEAVIPLPSGGDIPVQVTGDSQSQSAYSDNRVYNFTGTSEEFQQFKAYIAEQERNFDARAVGAIREAEQSNYKFGT